jgi:histidinol dehydrogenase
MFPILSVSDIASVLDPLLIKRSSTADPKLEAAVAGAYSAVSSAGDAAILDYTRRIDATTFPETGVYLSDAFVGDCVASLRPDLLEAINLAIRNIGAVNQQIISRLDDWTIDLAPGHTVGERSAPLGSALLWVPARKAPLLSTAIMLCVAASVAGVGKIILATPPTENGLPDRNTIAAGYLAGARHFVCGNGLAIIAGAATGNWRHGRVHAIYGPGPQAISLAMQESAKYGVATQSGVGPSDSMLIFENSDDPGYFERLARNFLTELEHGFDSYTYALTTDRAAAGRLQAALTATELQQFGRAEHYRKVAKAAHGAIIMLPDLSDAVAFANRFAAEHLSINLSGQARQYVLDNVVAAEILDGSFTPFAAGNYCIGVTAVLPTNGFARAYSGITSRNFLRFTSYARLEAHALAGLLPAVEAIGGAEKLPNHVEAVRIGAR